MKTSIGHLPQRKQQALNSLVAVLKKQLNLKLLILFGSYARGDWMEELNYKTLQYRYQSDFDLLVITETPYQAMKAEQSYARYEQMSQSNRKTPVNLLAEDIELFNRRLHESHYFYIDIQQQGILLFDDGQFELADPIAVSPQERAIFAQSEYDHWFNTARGFYQQHSYAVQAQEFNIAAFLLHQAAERLYTTVALVFTRYKYHSHDLARLMQYTASLRPQLLKAFPMGTEKQQRRFELLRQAYQDARYKPGYQITLEELTYLDKRVLVLQQLTERLCREKIELFHRQSQ